MTLLMTGYPTRYLFSETMCEPTANHCEISMLANIRRIAEACQPAKFKTIESFRPVRALAPECRKIPAAVSIWVYNQDD